MFALNRMSVARQDAKYNPWAIQLAETAHARFLVRESPGTEATESDSGLRLEWKLSVDLQDVAEGAEGSLDLDPMDVLVTYRLLQHHASAHDHPDGSKPLMREVAEMEGSARRKVGTFATDDELDAGEALWLAQWAAWLARESWAAWLARESWAGWLHHVALRSIERLFRTGNRFRGPARQRQMHREMAAVLGLQCGVLRHPRGGGVGDTERQMWRQRVEELLSFWDERLDERDASMSPLLFASALLLGVWNPWEQRE